MRIRTLADIESGGIKNKTWLRVAIVFIVIFVWVFVAWLLSNLLFNVAMAEVGHPTQFSAAALTLSAFGGVPAARWVMKKLDKLIDEQIVGRVRMTYIRTTENSHETRMQALDAADESVTEAIRKIEAKCKGSTLELRTNEITKSKGGYRVTTYITVLVAGNPLPDNKLRRDDSPTQCKHVNSLKKNCPLYTRNRSGLCDRHQW